jgi:hypothetical protein
MIEPVYPKEDPEYRKKVFEQFMRQVRNTRWIDDNDYQGKPRGRKSKKVTKPKSIPRSEGEQEAYNKFFNYNK